MAAAGDKKLRSKARESRRRRAVEIPGNVHGLDEEVSGFGVTPRQIIQSLAEASMDLHLPHAVHIHCNNLGVAETGKPRWKP
jgi:formylmethanofuran dehydrogenase subunit A